MYIYIYVLISIVNLTSDDGKLPNHRYMLFHVQGSFPEKKMWFHYGECGHSTYTLLETDISPAYPVLKGAFEDDVSWDMLVPPGSSYVFFQARRETNHLSHISPFYSAAS